MTTLPPDQTNDQETTQADTNGQSKPDLSRPNYFDLSAIRAIPDLSEIDVEKQWTEVLVGKPKKDKFFRVRPGNDFWVDGFLLEFEDDRQLGKTPYWVALDLLGLLKDHLQRFRLFTCIDPRGNVFLWPVKIPDAGTNTQAKRWARSALKAAEEAEQLWIKIIGNMSVGAYEIFRAKGDLGEPEWPDLNFQEIVELAFQDQLIDTIDHPVIKRLNGELA